MTEQELYKLRFPIGGFIKPEVITTQHIQTWIEEIKSFPILLKESVKDLTTEQKSWCYRPNGWQLKQVVHHCADSHINALIRFKLCLTENCPTIKPYIEQHWAELAVGKEDDLIDSITMLTIIHKKLFIMLSVLSEAELQRQFVHPEHNKKFSIKENIGIYAWHGKHHLAHIKQALAANGKYN